MANENITKEDLARDLTKLEENLGRMIAKGFDGVDKQFTENEKQHQQIFLRLDRIEIKLEGVVYRREFEEVKERLQERLEIIEDALAIKRKQ